MNFALSNPVHRRMLFASLLCACALCTPLQNSLHSAENPSDPKAQSTVQDTSSSAISIDMYADREQASIGDEINLTITYAWPNDYNVDPEPNPAHVLDQSHIFVVNAPPVTLLNTGTHQQRRWNFTILAQQSGAWSLPRPGFQATSPDGKTETCTAPELILQIGIVEKPPQLSAPSSMWSGEDSNNEGIHKRYWRYIVIGLFLIIGSITLLFKRKQDAPVISPIETFEKVIGTAKSQKDLKESAALLSFAVRQYCTLVWSFDGIGATSREMRTYLKPHLSSEQLSSICNLLDQLETFRWSPQSDQSNSIVSLIEHADNWCHQQEKARLAALAEEET